MLTRGWIEVDLAALVRNAHALWSRAGVPLIPMVKADAYGLGAARVARALDRLPPLAFGVATVAEGVELREAGIMRPVIIFTPLMVAEMKAANEAGLTPALGSAAEIEAWAQYRSPYELSIDTGMARAGVPWREVRDITGLLRKYPPRGVFTHFHSADSIAALREQESRFMDALAFLPARPGIVHTDSSAAIARHDKSLWNAARPGIFLYGVGSGEGAAIEPECVVHMKAHIVEIRRVESGDTVSYDATWTAPSRRLIATVPVGYADGYPRNASNKGVGVVRSRAVPIAGRVTMDMIMFDVTDTGAEVGDIVTLIGDPATNEGAPIDVAAIAALAGMSPYELLTGLRGRAQRVYQE